MQVQHTIRVGTLRPQTITVTVTRGDLSNDEVSLPEVVHPILMAIKAERTALMVKRSHFSGRKGEKVGEQIRARVEELDTLYRDITGSK